MHSNVDFIDDLVIHIDTNGSIIEANESYLNLLNKNIEDILEKKEKDFLEIISTTQENINSFENKTQIYEETINFETGKKYFRTRKEYINLNGESKIKITRRNITEFTQYFSLYNSHIYLLELIAQGKPLEYILNEIIKSVEDRNPNMICSILLFNAKDNKLYKGAAPSLPDYYNEKLNGMIIGEKVGSCGAAAFLKQRVIVDDISSHENWKYAKNLAEKFNLKACWSQPIFSSNKEILGTFAIYYNKPKFPSNFDIHLIEDVANVTGVAIDKHMQIEQLKKEREENKRQEQLLIQKSKQSMMGEMLENIAHQWKQPLSVISLYATGILYKKELGRDTSNLDEDAFKVISTNAQYLSDTIENFRKYFTSNSQKVYFTLKESIEYTLKLFEGRMKTEDIKIVYDLDDVELFNFRNELTQVFINIFNNSADALKLIDKEDRYIHISSQKDDEDLNIYIIDSGNGTSNEVIEKLFEPYFTTKGSSKGTGIGLYMSYDIIEKHMGGKIKAENDTFNLESKEYKGLKFTIKLPLGTKE